jgi:transglutaminase-like putative cysteine protease
LSFLRPLPARLTRPLSLLLIAGWLVQMGVLVHRVYLRAPVALAADLASYGASAQWRGIYYRGEKIGFAVGQTTRRDDGFELREDGRLQMTLLGATTAVQLKSVARVDKSFALRSFSFSLDPGTGPTEIAGVLDGRKLELSVRTASGERKETRELPEPPALSVNLPRQLAARGLAAGQRFTVSLFDPATLQNAPMTVEVQAREIVQAMGRPVPAFRVEGRFRGVVTKTWITDVGEIVREESPMGLMIVRETPDRAQAMAVPGQVQMDLLEAAAIVPTPPRSIDEPTAIERLRVRLDGVEAFGGPDLQGAGQRVEGDVFEVRDSRTLAAGPDDLPVPRDTSPEPFLESDAPEIGAEARKAVGEATLPRARAERLVRYVHALLEKKPTVSLPSALEVLKTRVGDCNEHTALYVAMARSLGLPSRVAVGLVYLRGAFYYHAWPEVYASEGPRRGLWLPVDPTLNQFPADATHLRLARGGLDRQAAILGLIGRARIRVLDVQEHEGASTPVLVGRAGTDTRPLALDLPRRDASGPRCWSSPGRR